MNVRHRHEQASAGFSGIRALVLTFALLAALALSGCATAKSLGSQGAAMVSTSKVAATAITCRTNRAQLGEHYSLELSSGSANSPDIQQIARQIHSKCPAGGTYSWDAQSGVARCSVHGE